MCKQELIDNLIKEYKGMHDFYLTLNRPDAALGIQEYINHLYFLMSTDN